MASKSSLVFVRQEILLQAEKLIKKEKGQPVLEGLELLLNNNLVDDKIQQNSEVLQLDKQNADDFITLGMDWLAKYPHAALGVAINADIATIRKAFKKKALKYHPDKNASTKILFQAISSACEILCNGTSSNTEQSYEQKFERYRDEFIRRKQEEEFQRQQEERQKQEEETRRQKQAQREEYERAQSALDEEEEELNWRSQRARQKQKQDCSSHLDSNKQTDTKNDTERNDSDHFPSVGQGKGQSRRSSNVSSGLPHSNMTVKEELQWRKLQRQYEQLLSKVARHEERFEKEMDKQRKMFGKAGASNGESSLPYLYKKKARGTSANSSKAPGGVDTKTTSSQNSSNKPTSAPHRRVNSLRSNSAVHSSQQEREQIPPEAPIRPKTERSQHFRKSHTMPCSPRAPIQKAVLAPTNEGHASSFIAGASDLRKKYNHLFSQNAYSKHSKSKNTSATINSPDSKCLPTGDLSDRGNIVYSYIY